MIPRTVLSLEQGLAISCFLIFTFGICPGVMLCISYYIIVLITFIRISIVLFCASDTRVGNDIFGFCVSFLSFVESGRDLYIDSTTDLQTVLKLLELSFLLCVSVALYSLNLLEFYLSDVFVHLS